MAPAVRMRQDVAGHTPQIYAVLPPCGQCKLVGMAPARTQSAASAGTHAVLLSSPLVRAGRGRAAELGTCMGLLLRLSNSHCVGLCAHVVAHAAAVVSWDAASRRLAGEDGELRDQ